MIKWMKLPKEVTVIIVVIVGLLSMAAYVDRRERVVLQLGFYADSSWGVPQAQQYQWIDSVIDRFEKQHPGVTIEYESGILKKDYTDWLAEKTVTGKSPDVFLLSEEDLNIFASTGALVDVTNRLESDLERSIFYEVSLAAGQYGVSQYALPLESNPMMICINTDLLEKEGVEIPKSGWTLADFYKICQQLTKDTDGDGVIDQFGFTDYDWQQALSAYGQSLFDPTGREVYLNSDTTKEALAFITKLQALNGQYQVTNEDFDQGHVAFSPMTLAQYRTYRPYPYHISKYSSFSWTCIKMPALDSHINATQVETSLVGMSSTTSHRQLVWEFMQLLTAEKSVQQDLVEYSQGISVLKEVMESPETIAALETDNVVSQALTVRTIGSMMSDARTKPKFKAYKRLVERADYLISHSLNNGTIETDLIAIQKELEQDLQ